MEMLLIGKRMRVMLLILRNPQMYEGGVQKNLPICSATKSQKYAGGAGGFLFTSPSYASLQYFSNYSYQIKWDLHCSTKHTSKLVHPKALQRDILLRQNLWISKLLLFIYT
jgi:hypothetical protein